MMGAAVFDGCASGFTVYYLDGVMGFSNPWYGYPTAVIARQDGDYIYIVTDGNATITGYTGAGGAISIPATLGGYPTVAIGDSVFSNNGSLTSVIIPDSVTSIGGYAFYNCWQLTSLTLSSSLTSIGDWAFYYCYNLTSVTIPDSVTTIGGYAFLYCYGLTMEGTRLLLLQFDQLNSFE